MQEQFVPNSGQIVPKESRMSTAAHIADARDMAKALERRMIVRGHTQESARFRIADKLGCTPGTLLNLSKSRLKRVESSLRDALRLTLIKEYEREIKALTHELERLRQSDAASHCLEIQEIESCLEAARKLLARASLPASEAGQGR